MRSLNIPANLKPKLHFPAVLFPRGLFERNVVTTINAPSRFGMSFYSYPMRSHGKIAKITMVSQLAKCATLRQILEFETQVSVSLVFCHKTFASPDDPFEKVNFACHKRIQYRSVPLHIYTSEGLFF